MYFEDQKKQGRNRSFAQVENISNKHQQQKMISNQTYQAAQMKHMLGSTHQGTTDQTNQHQYQEQPSQSAPSQPQYSSLTAQTILNKIKGQASMQYPSQMTATNNSGLYKTNSIQNTQNNFQNSLPHQNQLLHHSQISQQAQQISSQISKTKQQNTNISSILQEQHINLQQNKSQVSSASNSALNRASQIKNASGVSQNIQSIGNCSQNFSQVYSNTLTNQQQYQQDGNQSDINSNKRSVQYNSKARQQLAEEHNEQANHQQHQITHQSTVYNNIQSSSNTAVLAQQTSSITSQQQQQASQPLNKLKRHQRHHSEIAISKHLKQYSIIGTNLQLPTSIASNNANINQAFSKDAYNKENLNFYEIKTTGSNNNYNGLDQNTLPSKQKIISPLSSEVLNKFGNKNEQSNSSSQSYNVTQFNGKSVVNNSQRSGTNNPGYNITNGNIGNTQSNTLKIETSKEGTYSYSTLRQKHSRQNSLNTLPTHHQFRQNGIEIPQLEEVKNIINHNNDNPSTNLVGNSNGNNKNSHTQNVESLKTKKHPNIYTQKQEEQKKPQLKQLQIQEGDLDKQILSSNVTSNDLRNKVQQVGNSIKNTNFSNYSILAQDVSSGFNNQQYSRRTSSILIGETPQNFLNLVDNLSYQSTNRSLHGINPTINSKYEQSYHPSSNAISPNISATSTFNKSSSSSVHKSNQQQQKDTGYSIQNLNIGMGSNQNSTTNLQYNTNSYTIHSTQTQTLPTPSNISNITYQPKQSNIDICSNDLLQFNLNLNNKACPSINNDPKNQFNLQTNTSTYTNASASQFTQGQSLSSHPTHREQDFSNLQDYNPKSLIEKRRKSHSISNNIISSHSHNIKQAVIGSNIPQIISQQATSNSQISSHQLSTNSIMSQNVSHNNSQIMCQGSQINNNQYNSNSNKSPQNTSASNISNVINPFSTNLLPNTSKGSNALNKSNLSNVSNSNSSTINTANNTAQNYISNNNYSTNNCNNKGYNSGSKQNNQQGYPNQSSNLIVNQASSSNNNLSNISDSSKASANQHQSYVITSTVKPANLTFAEQLKIEKQKKMYDINLNIQTTTGLNSERNNNKSNNNIPSNTANNSYSYCSNNSNNTSAINTPYAISSISEILPKNLNTNYSNNSNNNILNNNNISEVPQYSAKNSSSNSLQNTYAKPKDVYPSSSKAVDILTNPNSSRGLNQVSNNLNLINNQEPLSIELQAINALLQQAKYLPSSTSQNEQKYFTLQYNKLNKFDTDIILPTSAPSQIINPIFNEAIHTPQDQLLTINKTSSSNSAISNKKSSPSNSELQNINQLKLTAKPSFNAGKNQDAYENLQQPKSAKGENDLKLQVNNERFQQPISSRQNTYNNNIPENIKKDDNSNIQQKNSVNNIVGVSHLSQHISNKPSIANNPISSEIRSVIQDKPLVFQEFPNYDQSSYANNQSKTIFCEQQKQQQQQQQNHTLNENYQSEEIGIQKQQLMQNAKQIQQKMQQQPVKWYLHDSQAQFEEEEEKKKSKKQEVQKPQIQKNEKSTQIQNASTKIQNSLAESISIQQNLLNSQSSSLTQISTYREGETKGLQDCSYVNNYTNLDTNQRNKYYELDNYSSQPQLKDQKFKKDTSQNESNQITLNKAVKNESNQPLQAYAIDIKDSYLIGFEDLAEYFSQNNGVKPSNNTPEAECIANLSAPEQKFESTEFNNLIQSVESLSLQSMNANPFINIENQEDEPLRNNYIQFNKDDVFAKKKKHTASPDIESKYYEEKSQNFVQNKNVCQLDEYQLQSEELEDLSTIHDKEFSSHTNLYQKPTKKNTLKNMNDWEGLCQIDEGEYDLQADHSEGDSIQNYSLNVVGEEVELENQLNSTEKQIHNNKFQDDDEIENIMKDLNEGSLMEEGVDENIDEAELLCDEDDLHEAMQSNISNILNDIDNDDPNQAFYTNNYYDQPCFNVESYSNYKNYNQSYSNAPSNQKPELDHHFAQNPFIAPFVETSGQNLHQNCIKQPETKQQLPQNKPQSETQRQMNQNNKKVSKENQKENNINKDDMLIDNEIKQSYNDLTKKYSSMKLSVEKNAINSHRNKELSEKQTKEEQLAKLQQELDEFDKIQSQFPIFGGDHLTYLLNRETDYQPNPYYMQNQKQFNPTMRAILLDWMMEVSEEFGLKRETYYIAVNIVDRMFSTKTNLQIKEFQLIGVTSLHIASKLEEIYPKKVDDFILSTDNGYNSQMIHETEKDILKHLNYMINPPTVSFWGNWFMSQWDIFIQTSDIAQNSQLVLSYYTENSQFVQFKQANSKSYDLFREYMQIVDFTILSLETLHIKSTALHCSIMYIALGKAFGIFTPDNILNEIAEGFIFTESFNEFNNLYNSFTGVSFGMTVDTIVPYIQYVSQFFILPVNNAMPYAVSLNNQPLQGNYEDFLQYQTHNKQQISMYKILKK